MPARADPTRLAVGGLILIGLALAGTWFLRNFERHTYEVDEGYSTQARRNPFLAAERYLRRLGAEVTSVAGRGPLRELPPTSDILIVNNLGPLNADRRSALQAWVEAGGDLVVTGLQTSDPDETRPDDVLATFGVRLLEADGDVPKTDDGRVLVDLTFGDHPRPLRLSAPARLYLQDQEDRAQAAGAAEDGRYRLIQIPLGAGRITVSADNRFLTNAGIGEHDHAALLARVATRPGGGRIWLLYDSGMPGLLDVLWRAAPWALASGTLLVICFLWHLGWRLGPEQPHPAVSVATCWSTWKRGPTS